MIEKDNSLTGLTEAEAKEVHKYMVTGFVVFTGIAIVAHILVWMWRPWLPSVNGYGLLQDAGNVAQNVLTMIA